MADEGRNAEWDEVGKRFSELGRSLQHAWSAHKPERTAAETEEQGRNVGAALEDLKSSITRTVADPEVREAAGKASTGLTEALASNLRQLAEWLEQRKPAPGTEDPTTTTGTGGGDLLDKAPGTPPPADPPAGS